MPKVEARKTRVTAVQMYTSLEHAWIARFGSAPSRRSLLVLLAQWAFETGHGKSMWNYNVGNIKSRGKTGTWCFFRCNEIINDKEVWFEPDHPACCFRAYATLDEGAADYLEQMHETFDYAWSEVIAGNPSPFVSKLKAEGYFTGNLARYTESVVSLFKKYDRELRTDGPTQSHGGWATVRLNDTAEMSVRYAQSLLAVLGYYRGGVDGEFGPKTDAAVRRYQTDEGLEVDGIVGPITWEHLLDDEATQRRLVMDTLASAQAEAPPAAAAAAVTGNPVRLEAKVSGTGSVKLKN